MFFISEHIIVALSRRYPQLLLPLSSETKNSQDYKDAVLRGKHLDGVPQFLFSSEDRLQTVETPAGKAEILYLAERADFVHCIQALAYRCDPREVPSSIGASTIRGLINWEKINRHKADYLNSGGLNWPGEFKRFTANKANYCDTLIVLSKGPYSAVPAETVGFSLEEWDRISLKIRKYHELTHFVCRSLFPEQIDPVRDEIIADMIGLLAALGQYDTVLARLFLGLENSEYRKGGRLEYYAAPEKMDAVCEEANRLIEQLAESCASRDKGTVFDILFKLY